MEKEKNIILVEFEGEYFNKGKFTKIKNLDLNS